MLKDMTSGKNLAIRCLEEGLADESLERVRSRNCIARFWVQILSSACCGIFGVVEDLCSYPTTNAVAIFFIIQWLMAFKVWRHNG